VKKVKSKLWLTEIRKVGRLWDFTDTKKFVLVHHFMIPKIYTWGEGEPRKREEIRKNASIDFPVKLPKCQWYAFCMRIKRSRFDRPLDIENVPKLIIDAFSKGIVDRDESLHANLVLYSDDDLEHARAFQVEADFSSDGTNSTEVWIYGKR